MTGTNEWSSKSTGTTRNARVVLKDRSLTMKSTRMLMLAAVAALTLGTGAAMAQGLTPSGAEGAYYSQQRQNAPRVQNGWAGPVQSGSSDVGAAGSGQSHIVPFNGDYGDLSNPG
jgi:hypothetical protein